MSHIRRPYSRVGGRVTVLTVLLAGLAIPTGTTQAEEPVTIFAAASTTDAVTAIAAAYQASGGGPVRTVFASSSTLARQIAQGAPADLYLSANPAWMDDLAGRDGIEPESRIDLLSNSLVLIAPADRPMTIDIAPRFPLAAALGDGRIALGDPIHVPAGIYAKEALSSLGVWHEVESRAAFAGDVRAALALVDSGEAAAGIVYSSDAAIGRNVRVVATFPAELSSPIIYPLAIVRGRTSPKVDAVYRFLQGPTARAIWRANGFTEPGVTKPAAAG